MASIFAPTPLPTQGLAAATAPWENFDWPAEIQKRIYRDWGKFHLLRRGNTALRCFNSAMELDNTDYKTLFARARLQRKTATIEKALNDARRASKMASEQLGPSAAINTEVCELLYEMNRLEDAAVELTDNQRFFVGHKSRGFESLNHMTEKVIKNVLGESLKEFFKINRDLVLLVDRLHKENSIIDDTVLWKKLRDLGKCDTQSTLESEEEEVSPLERARRTRAYNIFNQTYLNKSGINVFFLKELRKNPCLLLEQCHRSNAVLKVLSETQYGIVKRFMKMLHTRMPLYYVDHVKYTNKKMQEKCKREALYRWQYQTHRNMLNNLRHIRKLREEKRLTELAKYVESIMGDYVVLKTDRVMCWKFEFMNEVYNNLALALIGQYTERNLKNAKADYDTLNSLLHLPKDKVLEIKQFVFGDRSTYEDKNDGITVEKGKRKLLARLEGRLKFAKYPIERAYLNHQIAGTQLLLGSFEECCYKARQALKESKECNNYVWQFLSVMQMLKAFATQHKLERTTETLLMALPIAETLKNPKLSQFILFCSLCIEDETIRKNSIKAGSQLSSTRSSKTSTNLLVSPLASTMLTDSKTTAQTQ